MNATKASVSDSKLQEFVRNFQQEVKDFKAASTKTAHKSEAMAVDDLRVEAEDLGLSADPRSLVAPPKVGPADSWFWEILTRPKIPKS